MNTDPARIPENDGTTNALDESPLAKVEILNTGEDPDEDQLHGVKDAGEWDKN